MLCSRGSSWETLSRTIPVGGTSRDKKLNILRRYKCYVGQTSSLRRRFHQEYRGVQGSHLKAFFDEALRNGCQIWIRCRPTVSDTSLPKVPSQILGQAGGGARSWRSVYKIPVTYNLSGWRGGGGGKIFGSNRSHRGFPGCGLPSKPSQFTWCRLSCSLRNPHSRLPPIYSGPNCQASKAMKANIVWQLRCHSIVGEFTFPPQNSQRTRALYSLTSSAATVISESTTLDFCDAAWQNSPEAARKKEARLLKQYDYPWNSQQAGCRPRHVDIVVQHSCCSKSTHLVARSHQPSPKKLPPGSTATAGGAHVEVAVHDGAAGEGGDAGAVGRVRGGKVHGGVVGQGKEGGVVGKIGGAEKAGRIKRKDGKVVPTWQSFGSASEAPV